MNYNKGLIMIKDLLSRVRQGEIENREREPRIKYGHGQNAIQFCGETDCNYFMETAEFLWTGEICETYTFKTIKEELLNLISDKLANLNDLTEESIKSFLIKLKKKTVETFEVFYPLFGVEYISDNPLALGRFKIYNLDLHKKELLKNKGNIENLINLEDEMFQVNKIFISVLENARESSRANEKAKIKLRQFEDTVRFMVGNFKKNFDIGIFNYYAWKVSEGFYISSPGNYGTMMRATGAINKIPLHQFQINDPNFGYDRLWEILNSDNPSDIENRIISAIGWAGKAIRDEEPQRALVQYVFALEALLQFQQKGSLVTPSITSQISEFATFIIGENLKSRLEIERKVKDIYKKRSAIVHGGSNEVSIKDLYDIFILLKELVIRLVTDEKLKQISKIEQLSEWVKSLKFS